ncbi:hypothetical protein BGZ94_005764, partial [Podila epigama]
PGTFFDKCPKNLTKLSLLFMDSGDIDSEFEHQHASLTSMASLDREIDLVHPHPPPKKNQIQTLKLVGGLTSYNSPHILRLIRHLGHLESLHLDTFSAHHSPLFAESLARYCPRLVHLNAMETPFYDNCDVLPLLRASVSGWKSLVLPYCFRISHEAYKVIVDHSASSLEEFVLERDADLQGTQVRQMLSQFESLRVCHLDSWCDVTALLHPSVDWACARSLESLRIVLNGIPRPDIKENHNGRPLDEESLHQGDSMDVSRTLQKKLCAQLGTLTRLKTLTLGTDFGEFHWADDREEGYSNTMGLNCNGYQYECLELTLESGLDSMAGLVRLEKLDLTRMSHRIGVPELEWMKTHWPTLETIVDLHRPGDPLDPGVEAWLEKNDCKWLHEPST